ncbi:MAG: TonB-dependent receptor [Pseudomonadota bacterium]
MTAALACATGLASPLTNAQVDDDTLIDADMIEEVVVIGQKYERSLQDTPQSVSVIDAQLMQDENLLTLNDVLYRTPNAVSTFGGTGFSLRGVRNDNVSGGGFADLATIFLDGAPLSRDNTFVGTLDIWDLEQIEVLRGPQSTLQGRNSLAGAVIMKTADPTYEWSGKARVQLLSEIDERRYSVAFGGPLIDNQLAFRIAAEKNETDGAITNVTLDANADTVDSEMLRAKLLITPDAAPNLRMLFSYMYDDREFGQRDSRFDPPGSWDDRQAFNNRRALDTTENHMGIANISYQLSDTLDLDWITTYSASKRRRSLDGDATARESQFSETASDTDTLTSELRLSFTTERMTGLVGLWYSDIDNQPNTLFTRFSFDVIEQFQLPFLLQGPPFNLDAGTAGFVSSFYTDPFLLDADLDTLQQIETFAIFSDVTFDLTDRLSLLAGFRFDREEQVIDATQMVVVASDLPDPALAGPAAPVVAGVNMFLRAQADQANSPGFAEETTFEQFLPKFGLSYALTDRQTLSFIVQRGYRSGGVSGNAARVTIVPYDEETTWNYELAYRSQWLDDRLTLNANAYFTDWTDQQVTAFLSSNSFDSQVENAGKSELKGFELDVSYAPDSTLRFYTAIGYADTEFTEFSLLLELDFDDLSGNEFSRAPAWTLSGGFTWTPAGGWFVNVNANHTTDSFNSATIQDEGPDIPERTLVNFRAGWSNDNLGVYVIGRNVFDNEHFDSSFLDADGGSVGRWGQPQLFGVTLEANL